MKNICTCNWICTYLLHFSKTISNRESCMIISLLLPSKTAQNKARSLPLSTWLRLTAQWAINMNTLIWEPSLCMKPIVFRPSEISSRKYHGKHVSGSIIKFKKNVKKKKGGMIIYNVGVVLQNKIYFLEF